MTRKKTQSVPLPGGNPSETRGKLTEPKINPRVPKDMHLYDSSDYITFPQRVEQLPLSDEELGFYTRMYIKHATGRAELKTRDMDSKILEKLMMIGLVHINDAGFFRFTIPTESSIDEFVSNAVKAGDL